MLSHFGVLIDSISRPIQRLKGVWFGDQRIFCLLFADDVVQLASLSNNAVQGV